MPRSSIVVCPGSHGTVLRALSDGVPVLVSPGVGDHALNGARVTWAGAGLMLPRRLRGPSTLRWAVRRVLTEQRFRARAGAITAWSRENDGAERGAELVDRYGRGSAMDQLPGLPRHFMEAAAVDALCFSRSDPTLILGAA